MYLYYFINIHKDFQCKSVHLFGAVSRNLYLMATYFNVFLDEVLISVTVVTK